jgi:ferredoxin-type protein NapH
MHRIIRTFGFVLFAAALAALTATLFIGEYSLTPEKFSQVVTNEKHAALLRPELEPMLSVSYASSFAFTEDLRRHVDATNQKLRDAKQWGDVIYTDYTFSLTKAAHSGIVLTHAAIFFLLTFALGTLGALLAIVPTLKLWGEAGIKNNFIFNDSEKSRGWLGYAIGIYLTLFYIVLYFYPEHITSWVIIVEPLSHGLFGNAADQWFLYGLLYTLCVSVMGVRMLIKYRHINYQLLRTASVMMFQFGFAFLLPEILKSLALPARDLKNIFPLDYSFFYDYRLSEMTSAGTIGIFMLVWGLILFLVGVPVMTYFFGKRWYCSWVCGCGGLAETLGDPFRQLSDKSLRAWKLERYLIHGVMVFAVLLGSASLYKFFTGAEELLGVPVWRVQQAYGFLIGSVFAGVVGTGFYPVLGSRGWCRFGCPLAAYLGMVQRFKSRFRITTNGGQCISCGNCSTYCEMGIDVRAYAQRGENIVRSSCVGCGVCAAVCPRGVLKLENDSEATRVVSILSLVKSSEVKILS